MCIAAIIDLVRLGVSGGFSLGCDRAGFVGCDCCIREYFH